MIVYLQMIETDEDKSKFEEIYQEYRNLMYYVAYKRMQHEQDAEDVVHHVFVKIAENIKNIEPVSPKTKQLIVTMVDNRATDVFRVRGKHPVVMYDDELKNSSVTENECEDLLTECILKLPEQQRMVIWMKYKQGYSLREIAKVLDISLVWAQKIDQRAKKKLEELYLEGGGILGLRKKCFAQLLPDPVKFMCPILNGGTILRTNMNPLYNLRRRLKS